RRNLRLSPEELLDASFLVDQRTLGRGDLGRWDRSRLSLGPNLRGCGLRFEPLAADPVQPLSEMVTGMTQVGQEGGEHERTHQVDVAVRHLVVEIQQSGSGGDARSRGN